jgi:hypothetical protein
MFSQDLTDVLHRLSLMLAIEEELTENGLPDALEEKRRAELADLTRHDPSRAADIQRIEDGLAQMLEASPLDLETRPVTSEEIALALAAVTAEPSATVVDLPVVVGTSMSDHLPSEELDDATWAVLNPHHIPAPISLGPENESEDTE